MPGRNQKVVTIPSSLWEDLEKEYESRKEFWASRNVRSTTGLLRYFVRQGLIEDSEMKQVRDELEQLKQLVMHKIYEEKQAKNLEEVVP